MARLKPWEVGDELRAAVKPLLPTKPRRARWPSRKPTGNEPAASTT